MDDKEDLYRRAHKLWGTKAQMFMVMEEMSELQKEICKQMRGKDRISQIIEEIADVEIMLEQLQHISMIPRDAIEKAKAEKLGRLEKRIIGHEELLKENEIEIKLGNELMKTQGYARVTIGDKIEDKDEGSME